MLKLFIVKQQGMRKINMRDIPEESWSSTKGKFGGASKEISVALGRKPLSTDMNERHPFDVEISRVPPGMSICPYHAHSAQWEFYQVISGKGIVRHKDGTTPIEADDSFIFEPNQAHQLTNDGSQDLVLLIVADNPIGESCFYPDSNKWLVHFPERKLIRSDALDYYDGEE
jgi:uncharacterized cupin superfamily protein